MPEEKKEETPPSRKTSQSKTPDKKPLEDKSEDEGEFKIQMIKRSNEKNKESTGKAPDESDVHNDDSVLNEIHSSHDNESDDYQRKLNEKDFENLNQEEIDKILMQVCMEDSLFGFLHF